MTTVKINDKPQAIEMKIKDIDIGELFRYNKNNEIYLMTDEYDDDGDSLALLITDGCSFGVLIPFDDDEKVTRLNGTISVDIN